MESYKGKGEIVSMRKKKKRFISGLLCLVLSGSLLFGCGKEKETMDNNDVSNGQQEITDHSENKLPEQETQDDKQTPEKDKENSTADTSKIPEAEYVDITFDLLENYREKNIPSVYTEDNENEICCNVILNKENQIEYYTVAKETDGYSVWKYTLIENPEEQESSNGTIFSWEKEAVSWLEGIKKEISYGRITAFTGEDQKEYAWYIADGEISHLVKRDGDSFVEIALSDWHITESATVNVLENGNVVSADLSKTCSVYNQDDGSLLKQFGCGGYDTIAVKGNQVFAINRESASILHYDAKAQQIKQDIKANFGQNIKIAFQNDDIYVCSGAKGIYRAKENSQEFQKILDAGMYHFAKESTVLLKFFVVGDIFYIVYGEDKGTIKQYFPALPGNRPANSLTVYSLKNNDVILDMISEFQTEYPDIEILYETGEGSDGSVTAADHIRALNARILAGDGPDVLVMDGLPTESYIKKGILADLSFALADVKKELLPNFQEFYRKDDALYMLPLRFTVPMFVLSEQVPEEILSSLETLVEYSEEQDGVAFQTSYADIFEMLYYNYTPKLILDNETVDRKAIEEFLSLVKRYCESEGVTKSEPFMTYLQGRADSYFFAAEETELVFANIFDLNVYPSLAETRNGKLIGNAGKCFANGLLAINALSEKKVLADTFVGFAFSYNIQKRHVGLSGYPINIKVLDEIAQTDRSSGTIGDATISFRYYNQEESAWMIEQIKEIKTPFTREESVWEILRDAADGYLKGTKSLNESVDEVTNRIQMYLYEQ